MNKNDTNNKDKTQEKLPDLKSLAELEKKYKSGEMSYDPAKDDLKIAKSQEYESDNKFHDFFIDTNNKTSRIAFGIISLFVLFAGWLYRDQYTIREITVDESIKNAMQYADLSLWVILIMLGAIFCLFIANIFKSLLRKSRFKLSRISAQKKIEELNNDLTESKDAINTLNEYNKQKKSISIYNIYNCWLVTGYVLFSAGFIIWIITIHHIITEIE